MSQYIDIIIPNGSTFNNATIRGFGNVAFKDTPKNQFDNGFRSAKNGEYKILAVVDRSQEDTAPFAQPMNIDGFSVKIGTIVNIQLIKDVTNSIPKEEIIMTGANTNAGTQPTQIIGNGLSNIAKVGIALGIILVIVVLLKLFKVF